MFSFSCPYRYQVYFFLRTCMKWTSFLAKVCQHTDCHCSISKLCTLGLSKNEKWRKRNIHNIQGKTTTRSLKQFYSTHIYIYSRDTSHHTIIIVNIKAERKLTPFTFSAKLAVISRNALFVIYIQFLAFFAVYQTNPIHTLQFAHLQFLTSLNFNGISSSLPFFCLFGSFLYAVGITMVGT